MLAIRSRFYRWRYARYMQNEQRKIDALADSPLWVCGRCGMVQTNRQRHVRKYWEGSNYDGWPRADFVAMSCWDCGAPITKTVTR